ncbi:MAG: ATP-dependent DNA ligase, partial [Candidatus Aenigmarchaeota archaeon]|nr:ATP-dependent DNA ligase [Candidatus Aenigmarchaeota archaeon]
MQYARLAEAYALLEQTPSRLQKVEAVSALLREIPGSLLRQVTLLVQGTVFPAWDQRELGIANQLMVKALAQAAGHAEEKVADLFKREGDLGLVAERLARKQTTLAARKLSVEQVFENLQAVAGVEGHGAVERKLALVAELLSFASPAEAKYVVRTVLGTMRVGVAEGVIRDAIAVAFFLPEEKERAIQAVEWAWFLRSDYGEVSVIAKERGLPGLEEVGLEVGKPYHLLLAERVPSLEEGLKAYPRAVLEWKYDGARVAIHKRGQDIWLFTRRLEDITRQFPEVADWARAALLPRQVIVEGEMLAFRGKPLPFQDLSQRIKRKYDIEKIAAAIPVQVNLFDITLLEGRTLFKVTQEERRRLLEKSVRPLPGRLQLAQQLRPSGPAEAEQFYQQALDAGQEGVMIKNLDASYQPGRRVGYWLKVKPTLEHLDLAIIGGTWGTGKRTGWLGSLVLGCRTPEGFRACGMIGTGIKEKGEGVTFAELTRLLKPAILATRGSEVVLRPKIVVEVAYEEIQQSPTYASGWALRFPRVVRIREDKPLDEVDDLA